MKGKETIKTIKTIKNNLAPFKCGPWGKNVRPAL